MSGSGGGAEPLDPTVARGRSAVTDALEDVSSGSAVVLGVSGGADSLALAALTAFVAPRREIGVRCLVVDHGLQDGSAQVAAATAETLRGLGLEADVRRVQVGRDGGPEAAARSARRAALASYAQEHGCVAVLLAHTRDDQAETVLLGLSRGSGARSLAGIAPRDGLWRRPLLGLSRTDTEAVCRASGLSWWSDPHNDDDRYARVRVRRDVLPVLEEALGPGVAAALARTAGMLRDDADLLDTLAAQSRGELARPDGGLDAAGLAALPRALRTRVLRAAALEAGCPAGDLTAAHVVEVERLVTRWRGQGGPALPGGVTVSRTDGALVFRRASTRG
ncbi:tRNA lysidine(34) synthetase TilS [Mumia sp. DW29H23]|uniref:tRNA lysidine(34) synthetase TilS n=1 Tax=Mumia sp. DW29H23 TaxID=3421241 RepID=UPI003D68CA09